MIYFITDGRYTKIGVAEDPQKRLRELQTGNPLELSISKTIEGSFDEENRLHNMLHLYHIRGEWYDWGVLDDEVIDLLLIDKPSTAIKELKYNGLARSERMSAINKERGERTNELIYNTVLRMINEESVFITAKEIQKNINKYISTRTIAKGLSIANINKNKSSIRQLINNHNRRVFGTDNFTVYKKTLSIHNIKRAIEALQKAEDSLSQRNIAKKAGLHYNTVNNLWEDEEIQEALNKYNESKTA